MGSSCGLLQGRGSFRGWKRPNSSLTCKGIYSKLALLLKSGLTEPSCSPSSISCIMCGPLQYSLVPASSSSEQSHAASESIIAAPLPDGYWVEPFFFSKDSQFPDLIAFGLGFEGAPSVVRLYINPKNSGKCDP